MVIVMPSNDIHAVELGYPSLILNRDNLIWNTFESFDSALAVQNQPVAKQAPTWGRLLNH
jgi:hypothetical protein